MPVVVILAAYAVAGVLAGATLGGEWVAATNGSGIPRGAMLAAAFVLAGAGVGFLLCGRRGAAGRFYRLLALAAAAGAAYWSRVGWLGRWPDARILAAADVVLAVLALATVPLAATAARNVGMAARRVPVCAMLLSLAGSVAAVGGWCLLDLFASAPPAAGPPIIAAVTGSALVAAVSLPRRRT